MLHSLQSALAVAPARSPGHLVDRISFLARTAGNDVAYRFLDGDHEDGRLVTYRELDVRVRAIGARLRSAGAQGERVLIVQSPGLDYVTSIFACWYAGAVAVPTHPPLWNRQDGRLDSVAQDCSARFALTTAAWRDRLESGDGGPRIRAPLTWVLTDPASDREAR